VAFSFALFACAINHTVKYEPNLDSIEGPKLVIKKTIEQQPTAFNYVPILKEVTYERCGFLWWNGKLGEGIQLAFFQMANDSSCNSTCGM